MPLAEELTHVRLGELHPDARNPRLPDDMREWADDDDLLVYIANTFDPLNVAESIARHGYWSSEPLVVTEEGERQVVLEGNRRLTALLGLAREDLRERFDEVTQWAELASHTNIDLDLEAPVLVAAERRDADALIGYRHIAGIQQWSPLQRARFIAHLIEDRDQPFPEVAETVGEDEPVVRMHYRNQDILHQLRRLGRDDLARTAADRFGTFTAALNRNGLREFIGARTVAEVQEREPQLSEGRLGDVEELFSWIYGSEHEGKVIRETRDLTRLGEVVRNDAARAELRRTRDLEVAFSLTGGVEKGLYRQLAMGVGLVRSVADRGELLRDEPRACEQLEDLEQLARELREKLDCGDAEN